jgi:hypothetical protein
VKSKGQHENNNPFVVLKRFSVFGEYQLVFDLYPMCEFSPYVPSYNASPEVMD